jgi:hypothetical protein
MRRALIAVLLAGAVALSTSTPAQARWGWGWGLGAFAIGALNWRGVTDCLKRHKSRDWPALR